MRIYVGTYSLYNSGNLKGKWFDLEDYADKDEFLEACQEFHGPGEHEFMFQDYEGIPNGMVGECTVDEKCWDLIEAYDEFHEDAVNAYCYLFDTWDKDDFQDRYRGEFPSWEDMAEELLDETGELSKIPEDLRYYFDYEKYARDLQMGGDFTEHEGYFFWNH
jgi:antirestriction protein